MPTVQEFVSLFNTLEQSISQVIEGKSEVIRRVLTTLFAEGHLLLEDLPGVGKTRLAQALARTMDATCRRIQFTPDMLPNDIIGVSIYNDGERSFQFMPGPVFANIVLADEINRGTPRVQSSLLEAMSESAVTVDGQTHLLPRPFFVIATQNPVEFHGTYPLPEAQVDRFLMRLSLGYPDFDTEKAILEHQQSADPLENISPVATAEEIASAQAFVRTIHASERLKDYLVTVIHETRQHPAFLYGASPRAALALLRAAQCHAAAQGRDYVLPRDVRDLAPDVLAHRLPLRNQARAQWHDSREVLAELLAKLPMQRWEE
ncbi:MAG: MoxR family ATPase [Victivallales bacterium]|jgi:MoxR-like ATPase|nr:MoxR family ATPase [Victivallales bacterium]